jgi:hypothetical protein
MPIDLNKFFTGEPNRSQELINTEAKRLSNIDLLHLMQLEDVSVEPFQQLPYTEGLGEDIKYDKYFGPENVGVDLNEFRATLQGNGAAMTNGLVQALIGTVADIVGTPGYLSAAVENIKDMDTGFSSIFIDAAQAIKEFGQDVAPIYQGHQAQEAVFAPGNGEWWAQSIADFGPTLAMLAMSFMTSGSTTPALSRFLGKVGIKPLATLSDDIAKLGVKGWSSQAAKKLLKENEAYQVLRTANAATTSRLMESGMEAHEAFKEQYSELKRLNDLVPDYITNIDGIRISNPDKKSEEQLRRNAGDAAGNVWNNNMLLVGIDYLQYAGLGGALFPKISNKFLKAGSTLGFAMSSEAAEEGYQAVVQKEAMRTAKRKTNFEVDNSTFMQRLGEYMGDTDVQKAMVQGALGGAVFNTIGSTLNKISEKVEANKLMKNIETAFEGRIKDNNVVFDGLLPFIREGQEDIPQESMVNTFDKEIQKINEELKGNLSESEKKELQEQVKELQEEKQFKVAQIQKLKELHEKNKANPNITEELEDLHTRAEFNIFGLEQDRQKIEKKLTDLYGKEQYTSNQLTNFSKEELNTILDYQLKIGALKNSISKYSKQKNYTVNSIDIINNLKEKYEKELQTILDSKTVENEKVSIPNIKVSDNNIKNYINLLVKTEIQKEVDSQLLVDIKDDTKQDGLIAQELQ